MQCPRCETDIDSEASFCPECGLDIDALREEFQQSPDAPSDQSPSRSSHQGDAGQASSSPDQGQGGRPQNAGDRHTTNDARAETPQHQGGDRTTSEPTQNPPAGRESPRDQPRQSDTGHEAQPQSTPQNQPAGQQNPQGQRNQRVQQNQQANQGTGGQPRQSGGARTPSPQEVASGQQAQYSQDDGLLTRRRLLVGGGVAAVGVGLWQTGRLSWLLGGSKGWPVYPDARRVQLSESAKSRITSQMDVQADITLRAFTTADAPEEVRSWYEDKKTVSGWSVEQTYGYGAILKKDTEGIVVIVQERGQLIDLGLPSETPTPTDLLFIRGPWTEVNQ